MKMSVFNKVHVVLLYILGVRHEVSFSSHFAKSINSIQIWKAYSQMS